MKFVEVPGHEAGNWEGVVETRLINLDQVAEIRRVVRNFEDGKSTIDVKVRFCGEDEFKEVDPDLHAIVEPASEPLMGERDRGAVLVGGLWIDFIGMGESSLEWVELLQGDDKPSIHVQKGAIQAIRFDG